jgi:hypothetical protein
MYSRVITTGLNALRASLLVLVIAFMPAIATALPTPDSGGEGASATDKQNLDFLKAISSGRVPLQGGNFIDLPNAYSNQKMDSSPAPESIQGIPKLPAMKGFSQIANSADFKKMLRQLISAEIPVMYQTMMMVENGAATGFMGSMNTVSNMVSNLVETQDLQLTLFDAVESTNSHKRAYVDSMYKSQSSDNKDVWPAALMFAAGDKFPDQQMVPPPTYAPNPSQVGSSPVQRAANGTGTGAGGGNNNGNNNQQNNKYKLSELLFGGSNSAEDKEDFINWVGDYEVEQRPNGETAVALTGKIVQPTEVGRMVDTGQTITTPGGNQQSVVTRIMGYEHKLSTTTKDVWKNLNANIYAYCKFKKENRNKNKQIFDKKRPSSAINPEEWEKIQSLDINISLNIIDQYFKLILGRRPIDEIDCKQFNNPPLPRSASIERDSGSSFDDCGSSGGGAKNCLSKMILVRIAEFVAVSKTNYFYRQMWLKSLLQATIGESVFREVSYVFCSNLGLGAVSTGNGMAVCDPQSAFEERLDANRLQWLEFVDKFSKLAQGLGSGSGFRPGSNNLSNFRADATR